MPPDAAQTFAAILQEDAGNVAAIAGLARAYLALGDTERAKREIAASRRRRARRPTRQRGGAALIDLAEAARVGEADELEAAVAPTRTIIRRASSSLSALVGHGDGAGRDDTLIELFLDATATGTTARRKGCWSAVRGRGADERCAKTGVVACAR